MLRNLFRFLIVLIVALFVRRVVLLIVQAFSRLTADNGPSAPKAPQAGGELKKDPVCGTFVAVASSIKRNVDGEVVHFCSTTCRDKYRIA